MNDVQCLLVHEANIRSFDNVLTAYATPFLQQYEQNQNKMDLLSLHYVELLNSPFFSFVRLVFEFMMVCIAHCAGWHRDGLLLLLSVSKFHYNVLKDTQRRDHSE